MELESSLEVEERGKLPNGYSQKVMSELKWTRKRRKLANSSRSVQQTLPRPFEHWKCKVVVNPGDVVVMPCHEERTSRTKQGKSLPLSSWYPKKKVVENHSMQTMATGRYIPLSLCQGCLPGYCSHDWSQDDESKMMIRISSSWLRTSIWITGLS